MQLIRKAFKRLHYPVDVIAQCVRWYLAYSLSLRNLEEIMAERGIIGKRTPRAVLTGMCYSVGCMMRQGSSSLTRLTGQSAMTSST